MLNDQELSEPLLGSLHSRPHTEGPKHQLSSSEPSYQPDGLGFSAIGSWGPQAESPALPNQCRAGPWAQPQPPGTSYLLSVGSRPAPSYLLTAASQHAVARWWDTWERMADRLMKIFTVNFRTKHRHPQYQQKGGFPGISF